MDFFNFLRKDESAVDNQGPTPSSEDVMIFFGASPKITVPAEQARGKTIQQLFEENADELGIEPEQVNRFIDAGVQVAGNTVPTPGHVYQGSTISDEKG